MVEGFTEQLNLLINRGVPATIVEIESPKRANGISFPEEHWNVVMALLGLENVGWSRKTTNLDNVTLLAQAKPKAEVEVYMQNMENSLRYRPVLVELSQTLHVNIRCMIPHRQGANPEGADGTMHIYVYSAPSARQVMTIPRAFGVQLQDGTRDAIEPTRVGTIIYDDEGIAVAQALPWNVFILFDITHHDGYQELFRKILERAIPAALPEDWNEQVKDLKVAAAERLRRETVRQREKFLADKDRFRALYVNACTGRLEEALRSKRKSVDENERRVAELSQELVQTSRQVEVTRAELHGLESGTVNLSEKFGAEFDQLYANEIINRIEVDNRKIDVYTGDIDIKYHRQVYHMGPFLIRIHLDGRLELFSTRTPLDRVGAIVHPHIHQGTIGCLGNISNEVAKLLAKQEYVMLINLIIDFLQSYNHDSPYASLDHWPSEPDHD